jgi:hypothetical protein
MADGVRVPQLLPPGPNAREHHMARARRVKRERRDVSTCLGPISPPGLPLVVTLTRCSPRFLDDDNAVGAMKSVRDEVALWLGLSSDADARVRFVVEQRKVKRAHAGVLIEWRDCLRKEST